jgi:hypothetical protein
MSSILDAIVFKNEQIIQMIMMNKKTPKHIVTEA